MEIGFIRKNIYLAVRFIKFLPTIFFSSAFTFILRCMRAVNQSALFDCKLKITKEK